MQLASVIRARVYALIQVEDLNPRGRVYYPDIAEALVARYEFKKYPTKIEDFDESKGIEFADGRAHDVVIDKVVILSSGIYVDTRDDTDASDAILHDALEWLASDFGLTYKPEMISRRAYISELTFHSDAPLLYVHPVLQELCRVASSEVAHNFGQPLTYEPAAINLMYDKLQTAVGPAAFTVQRREGVPFSENKYYSSSPLKTAIHLKLLEMYEQAVIKGQFQSLPARS